MSRFEIFFNTGAWRALRITKCFLCVTRCSPVSLCKSMQTDTSSKSKSTPFKVVGFRQQNKLYSQALIITNMFLLGKLLLVIIKTTHLDHCYFFDRVDLKNPKRKKRLFVISFVLLLFFSNPFFFASWQRHMKRNLLFSFYMKNTRQVLYWVALFPIVLKKMRLISTLLRTGLLRRLFCTNGETLENHHCCR
jgi:hypothetical protein